ncbi:MAG TPA: ferritin family protein [Candidatus Omnitrophota bacterium]|nr:ferritin family protein [Candidatus Omnitrophota bacterium]
MRVNIDKEGNISIFDFSPVQAYKIAIRMENDGIDFYKKMLSDIKDLEAKHEIEFLIEEEIKHLTTFTSMLGRSKEISGDDFEEDDIVNYIKSKVFDLSREREDALKVEHRHTALEEALNMEKRSVVFYEGCLRQTKEKDAREAFEKILDEERSHQLKFAELLRVKCINSQKGCVL